MSLVSSILKKHKKPSFFARHRDAIAMLTDQELDTVISTQPEMMGLLQDLQISDEFNQRVVFSGMRQSPRNIHRFKLYDQSSLLIDALCACYKPYKSAEFLMNLVPKHKLTQAIFDFVSRQGVYIRLSNLPRSLITRNNCLILLDIDPDQWRHVPRSLIDEELAAAMFRADSLALKQIPSHLITHEVIEKGAATLSHFVALNAEQQQWIAKQWLVNPERLALNVYMDRPLDLTAVIDRYRDAERKRGLFDRKNDEAIFFDEVLRVVYLDDLWFAAKDKIQQNLIIKIHGKKLLEVDGFPAELKREWLESDLNI